MSDTQQTTPAPTSGTQALAVIPGDGIGPEVTAEALKVLEVASPVKFESTRYDLGAERYLATGEVLPDTVLEEVRAHDAILLGAVGGRPGDPNLPPGLLERGLLLRLRFEHDLTQAEIGAHIGVSQMQISRILRRCVAKLRGEAIRRARARGL